MCNSMYSVVCWCLLLFAIEELGCTMPQDPVGGYRVKRQTNRCLAGEFACRDGQCISKFDACDGRKDCGDGSDERLAVCSKNVCPRGAFRCAYGGCVDGHQRCNGVKDCADNSDELMLSCPGFVWLKENFSNCSLDQFQCRNGQCVNRLSVCDGVADCADRSDETVTHCNDQRACPKYAFRCAYGACIDQTKGCDSHADCADASDEDPVLCGRVAPGPSTSTTTTTARAPPTTAVSERVAGKCVIPFNAGTSYSLATCETNANCSLTAGDVVEASTIVFISCKDSFVSVGPSYVYCKDGVMGPENHACVKLCPPFVSPSLDVVCNQNGEEVSCLGGSRPGTRAESSCREGYAPAEGPAAATMNECLSGGSWLHAWRDCSPVCGHVRNRSPFVPLVSYGESANSSSHPWNAGLYVKVGDKAAMQICGGTLIAPSIILTAAHCVFKKSGEMRDASKLKIGLAKFYRDWDDERDIHVQKADVKSVLVAPIYDGSYIHYLHDLAILELTRPVELNDHVTPACLDLKRTYTLQPNMLGTVVGWGFTESGVSSQTLLKANLPYYDRTECINAINRLDLVTKDKFCAFYSNGTGVQSGDSGAGITFEFDGRHFVYGLVSTQVVGHVGTFTDVANESHAAFIQSVLNNITSSDISKESHR